MKRICFIISVLLLGCSITNFSLAQLTIVKAIAIDRDNDGDTDALEIQFSDTIDFSESNDQDSDWEISNYYDMSNAVSADDFTADVEFIVAAAVNDDEYARVEFTNATGGLLADDNSTPIYFKYTQTNAPIDAVVSLNHNDTLATMAAAVLADDYSPPKIDSENLIEIGTESVFIIDDTIKFEVTLLDAETGITILPGEYNGESLNWTTEDNKTFKGIYVVTEGDPDQTDLDFNNVFAKDEYGNISNTVNFNVSKGIDANLPEVDDIYYSPGDGNTLGIDSILTITVRAKNLESGLTCDSASVNGKDVSASFNETTTGYYTLKYTIASGDVEIDDKTQAVPITLTLNDNIYVTKPAFQDSTVLASPGIDANAPSISSVGLSVTSGLLGINDTIIFTVTASEPNLNPSTVSINGKNLKNKVIDAGGGFYEVEYVIQSGDNPVDDISEAIPISIILKDEAGNPTNNYNSLDAADCPGIDASKPSITSVTFSPSSGIRAINESIAVTIMASESNLTTDSVSLNGKAFLIAGTGPYTFNYNISESDNDVTDTNPIPIHIALTDGANVSSVYKTSNVNAGDCPGIDANRPGVKSVNFSPGHGNSLGIDSVLTVTLEAENAESGLTASTITVNGVDVSGSLIDQGSGFYSVEYKVLSGHGSITDETQAIPVSFAFNDGYNNTLPAFTGSTVNSTPGIDDTAPIISDVIVFPSSGLQGIGDTIILMVDAGETGLTAYSIYINSKNLINKITDLGTGFYEIEYVVKAGDNDISDAASIPLSIILKDNAGNHTNNFNNLLAGNCPGIDAHRPVISVASVTEQTMLYGNDYSVTISVNGDPDTYSLISGTIAGFNFHSLAKDADNKYFVDFTVGDLGYDIQPEDSYAITNLVLSDAAGNFSNTYSETINMASDPIYTVVPTAKVKGTYEVCEKDSAELTFQLTGSAPWSVNLFDGTSITTINGIDESPYTHKIKSVDINGATNPDTLIYKITEVTDTHGNIKTMTVVDSAVVHIYTIPIVDITDPPGNKSYNVEAKADTLVGDPVGGVFSGNGIIQSNNTFLASSAGVGTHEIIYKYIQSFGPGCFNSDTVEFTVDSTNATITFDNSDDDWRCDYESFLNVEAEVIDKPGITGNLYLPAAPAAMTDWGDNTATIDIQQLSAGTYELKYEYVDGTPASAIRSFTIESVSNAIDISELKDFCEDYDTVFVHAFNLPSPDGTGEYIFSGSYDDYVVYDPDGNHLFFYPDSVDPGYYELDYVYTSPNGCLSDTVNRTFNVNPLPIVSFSMNSVYNIDQGVTTISGNQPGGEFTPLSFMSNLGSGQAEFDPEKAGIGNYKVKYTYEDANGCENSDSTEVEVNKALGDITSYSGSFQYCYFSSSVDTITGTPDPTDGTPGNFYIDDILIAPESDNKILFEPQNYIAGSHTIKFEYVDGATTYYVYKSVEIDSIGDIYFTGLDQQYCEDEDTEIELTAFYPGQDGTVIFTGSGITDAINDNVAYFNPSNANLGDNYITYTFTRDYSGCQKQYSKGARINKTPTVAFYPNESCITGTDNLLGFTADTLVSDSIVSWEWKFRSVYTSNDESPQFPPTIGSNRMILTLETNKGCSNFGDSTFYIGTRVDLEFTFENECHGETVIFELLTSSDDIDEDSVRWNFDGSGLADLSDMNNPTYVYANPGAYTVVYEEFTKSCGRIADSVTVNIRPSIDLNVDNYMENFENAPGTTGWVVEDISTAASGNSWQWGEPVGEKINLAASGQNAFVTNLTGSYDYDEAGMVTSPCFDFTGMQRPMIKIDFVSYSEKDRDGAVIQYTKADGDWATIGVPNDGVNWYNSYIISGAPANQQLGWTGEITGDNNGWQTAMYRLDELRGRAGVRFRIVFGSDAAGDGYEGFAFDNIQFSERKRTVLLENFTNSTNDDAVNILSEINNKIEKDSADVIVLNYHTSFPQSNNFYSFYPSGPSARALFYGVSTVPYSIVDGESQFSYLSGHDLNEADIHKRMLIDPTFDIAVKQDIQGENLVVTSDIKSENDLNGYKLLVFVAIVEKTVVEENETYRNVLRTMLPDAAGILVEREWFTDDTESIYQSWAIPEGVSADSLMTIVFVQDNETKEIYQTEYTSEFSAITSTPDVINNKDKIFSVYPNPIIDRVYVSLAESAKELISVKIYSSLGNLIKTEVIQPGQTLINIDTGNLRRGVYFVKLTSENGEVQGVTKIIKSK